MSSENGDQQGNDRNDPPAQGQRPLKSGPSRIRSFSRFINYTARRVDVIWLNYEGHGVRYRTLGPGQSVNINTFEGHLWIFRDSETGDRLYAELREVFEPVGWSSEQGPPRRRIVYITNPLYSLRDRCLQEVRRLIPANRIEQLEVPRELRNDLLAPRRDYPVTSVYRQPQAVSQPQDEQATVGPTSEQQNMNNNSELAFDRNCTNNNSANVVDQNTIVSRNSQVSTSRSLPSSSQGRAVASSSTRLGNAEPRYSQGSSSSRQNQTLAHQSGSTSSYSDEPVASTSQDPGTSGIISGIISGIDYVSDSNRAPADSSVRVMIPDRMERPGCTSDCADVSSSQGARSAMHSTLPSSMMNAVCISSQDSDRIRYNLGSCVQERIARVQEVSCPMVSSTVMSAAGQLDVERNNSPTSQSESMNLSNERQAMEIGPDPDNIPSAPVEMISGCSFPAEGHGIGKPVNIDSPQESGNYYSDTSSSNVGNTDVSTPDTSVYNPRGGSLSAGQGDSNTFSSHSPSNDVDMATAADCVLPNGVSSKCSEDTEKSPTHKHCHTGADDSKFLLPLKKRKQ